MNNIKKTPWLRIIGLCAYVFLLATAAGLVQAGPILANNNAPKLRTSIQQSIAPMNSQSPWLPGTPKYLTIPKKYPQEKAPKISTTDADNIPLWTDSFTYDNVVYNYTMVGTDPDLGSQTSKIPVTIVPLKFVFLDGTGNILSAKSRVCGGTKTATQLTAASPLFTNHPFTAGDVNLGNTQYIDAFQRANFWKKVSATSPDYHVLFGTPAVTPLVTVTVSTSAGNTLPGPCSPIGLVDADAFDFYLQQLLNSLHIPAGTLPVFLTYNTFFTSDFDCCYLGWHSATDAKQTYVVSAYNDPYIFADPNLADVEVLSHELGEWMDDPLVDNQVPPWNVGQSLGCGYPYLEVADPVSQGGGFSVVHDGRTYHLSDLVFLPWFAQARVSSSVNGWYTLRNSYTTLPPLLWDSLCY